MDWLKEISGTITAIAALVAAAVGVLQYFKTRREKIKMVRESFDAVIASLASNVEVERLAGAILLRRFFDTRTEVGIADRPYWKEAVNVTTAILRGQETANLHLATSDQCAKVLRDLLPKAHFATLYAKPMGRPLVDTFITEVSQDTWIYFPWDTGLAFQPPIREHRA